MEQEFNTRILVIDDDEGVRDSFREILQPGSTPIKATDTVLEEAAAALFSKNKSTAPSKPRSSATFDFEYYEAENGQHGFDMVKNAIEADKPFAAVFVDMRMPGWDGLETVAQLRKVDKRCEVIFVTAFSDHSIEDIVTSVGTNVSYHCKPFSVEEIEQIATKAVYEWNKTKSLEDLITTISQLRAQQWQMEPLLKNILQQVSFLIGAHSAMIAMQEGDKYNKLLAIGNLCNDETSSYYLESIPDVEDEEIYQNKELAYFRLNKYGVLAIFEKKGKPLNQERTYLVRLFLEQAVLSIQNVGLQEKLLKQEKLSAIGQATGMIVHDLRNSIGVIEMIIDMVVESIDDRKYVMESLEIIREAAQSGVALAQDILDYTSNKGIEKYSVNGADLIRKIDKNVRPFCEKNEVALDIECPESIPMEADPDKLFRVISNLVKNAVESFPQRNRVELPKVNLSMNSEDGNIMIQVADNGPGIPDEVADSLFTPFSTHGKRDGTGLGLAIAKQIIELHGGSISVASSHEKGTVFKIVIPKQ